MLASLKSFITFGTQKVMVNGILTDDVPVKSGYLRVLFWVPTPYSNAMSYLPVGYRWF